jgi:glycosyltransferase involved in cell wall biosynthesis
MSLKFELFTQAYNEEYLLPYMVDFYKSKVGNNITFNLFDNGSTDKTVEVAKNLGFKIHKVITNGELRDDLLLSFKNNCWKQSDADYVIVCDVDEWIDIPSDLSNITIIKAEGWNMVGDGSQTPDLITNGVKSFYYDKTCVFSPKDIQEINYTIGGHTCHPIGNLKYSKIVKLYHMKFLSEDFLIKKYRLIKASLSQINLMNGWSRHYLVSDNEVSKEYYELLNTSIKIR